MATELSPEKKDAADRLKRARSDRDAILVCLSPLAIMATQAATSVRDGFGMLNNPEAAAFGKEYLVANSDALARARARMNELMEEFGDFINEGDGCPPVLADLGEISFRSMQAADAGKAYEEFTDTTTT